MRKLFIANRGEIAVRVARAARELGISTVAVCSEADVDAVHVRYADEHVVVGPAPAGQSYLDVDAVVAAAKGCGADAVHPGYGFLSENADFAERVIGAGMTWVGPSPEAIRLMGDKARARASAQQAGVPTIAGSDGAVVDLAAAQRVAADVGYPVAIKAAAGGGGRGIRVVGSDDELRSQLPVAQAEARAAFGSAEVYLERFVPRARHIEVQVFGDGTDVIHMGTRDCSMQRRRQKVVEEAGDLGLPADVERAMTDAAVRLASAVSYRGAGTVEFLYDAERKDFAFIEMNTRIQVEHPVTEMVWGFDLVQEQLLVARGQALSRFQDQHPPRGHAIEVRLNAEDPATGFMPSPGPLTRFRLPGGPFVRVDSGYEEGGQVPPFYDSLLAKVIVWGATRDEAISRLRRALAEVEVEGVATTVGFLRDVVDLPEFRSSDHHTRFLEEWMAREEVAV
ncbi:acetyl/propionyl/methylcrotonyl-CoA carboxylase subunit alpha [Angustibacter sp. Root456]|uniref:acetyl-CoA carboxylase biotin carboxylase subunit n=1 Tax=Angustibacter sp. Root456 TaxID=1736539 RepID=UPI0007007A35|nr:acetyl-CoA carboxylase biotin carboxylase subunit [Angustibacter sp. Root456]KQX66123.1 acetyl-CoA carboxylase biotin carboxylase subunit [Angustibacter sp. Root456]